MAERKRVRFGVLRQRIGNIARSRQAMDMPQDECDRKRGEAGNDSDAFRSRRAPWMR